MPCPRKAFDGLDSCAGCGGDGLCLSLFAVCCELLMMLTRIYCPALQWTELGTKPDTCSPATWVLRNFLTNRSIPRLYRSHTDTKCPSLFCCVIWISTHWCLWTFQWTSGPTAASLEHSDEAHGSVTWSSVCLTCHFWDANHEPARLLLHEVFLNFQAILNLCICFFLIIFLHTLEWIIPHIIRVHNSKSQWTLTMARHSSLNQAIHV